MAAWAASSASATGPSARDANASRTGQSASKSGWNAARSPSANWTIHVWIWRRRAASILRGYITRPLLPDKWRAGGRQPQNPSTEQEDFGVPGVAHLFRARKKVTTAM